MTLADIIRLNAAGLRPPTGIQPEAILLALADVESSGGTNNVPKHEPAYDYGGYYWKRAPHVRAEVRRWGAFAACSYSSWQILHILACEVGYDGDPVALRDDGAAIPWVVKALNLRIFDKGALTVRDVGDGWNSGSFKDTNMVPEYTAKLERAYDSHVRA